MGLYHTCALLVTGQLKCFGENSDGRAGFELGARLGDGANEMGDTLPFVDVAGSSGLQVVNVSASSTSTCVVFNDGRVKCFRSASRTWA